MTSQDYSMALGTRLRAVRRQLGMTLEQVEQRSQGRFKMIVVGSYERADRAITVQRLAELAEVYGVRTEQLLPGDGAAAGNCGSICGGLPRSPRGRPDHWPGTPRRSNPNAMTTTARY